MGRVVITGAGVVSPIGNNLEEIMEAIRTGKRGIGNIKSFNTNYLPSSIGAEVKKNGDVFRTESHIDRKEIFVKQAMEELFGKIISIDDYPAQNRSLHLGSGPQYFDFLGYARSNIQNGFWINPSKTPYNILKELARTYEIKGNFSVNVTTCVAATQAIGLSYRLLKGSLPGNIVFTGGFDSVINPLQHMAFYKLGVQSSWKGEPDHACRPFDKNRCGLVLGEGAAVLALQNAEDVLPGKGLAEIIGYSSTMDAFKVTDPHPEGKYLARSALNAIEEAGIEPNDIDCVHLHGTGTYKNALAESKAMQRIFPNDWKDIPVFSLKGQTGHLIGACGAIEMIGVLYSLRNQQVPPTVNFEEKDPEVPLRVVKERPLNIDIDHILKLNSAFGGQNGAFVVKRYVQ